ncbi:MAG: phosphopantetheine-binding protein [Caldilineaceae bacterium]
MQREQILDIVITNLKNNVEGLENTPIDPQKSMAEYGASSLDIVEVVSVSMRQLSVRVPRTALAGLTNINDLVDLLTAKTTG